MAGNRYSLNACSIIYYNSDINLHLFSERQNNDFKKKKYTYGIWSNQTDHK